MATALPNVGKGARYGDLKRRLLFLLGALVVFRIGAHIPVPGIDQMSRHRPAHATQPDEADGGHSQLLSSASQTLVVADRIPGCAGEMPTRGRSASTTMVSTSGPG